MSAPARPRMFYEDLAVGAIYRSGSVDVTEPEAIAFATRYDPQPFHTDPAAAAGTVFGGLVTSGWQTAALTMRLMVTGDFSFGPGVIGLGVESLRWPRPVRPGDRLTATVEVTAMRASGSKPDFGVVKILTTTANQRGETVQTMVSTILMPRRTT